MKRHEGQPGHVVFYGWWIIVVAGIGMFMGYGPIVSFTFGVFSQPMMQEFAWSRSETSLAYSLSLIAVSLVTPMVGRFVDRFGARVIIVPSALMFGLGLISLSFLSGQLWQFYAIYLMMGFVGGGLSLVPYSTVLTHWFNRKRGLALGLAAIGVGLSTFSMPSLAHSLIVAVGWRNAYMVLGVMVIAVTVPVVGLFLKEKPQVMGLLSDGESHPVVLTNAPDSHHQGMSCREALRTGTFWRLWIAFFLIGTSVIGCLIHLVPMLTDRGLSSQRAAFATSLLGGAVILGRVGAGFLLDRFFASYVAVGFFCGTVVGIFFLWTGVSGSLAFVAAILVGLGMGAENDIVAYLVSRYFGLRAYGEIYGYALISFAMGGVVGPLLMGSGFDATGSYRLVLGIFLVATLIGTILMSQLGSYQRWETTVAPTTSLSSH